MNEEREKTVKESVSQFPDTDFEIQFGIHFVFFLIFYFILFQF